MKKIIAALWVAALTAYGQIDTLVQVSSLDALMSGKYDGVMTLGELKKHGNTAIGTFDALDGELVMLDSIVYQIKADGSVARPDDAVTTPFAAVCTFRAEDRRTTAERLDYPACKAWLDQWMPLQNGIIAFRIDGVFTRMKTRSVPAQQKPYPPLAEVTKTQPEFELSNVEGTLVGMRCPSYMSGVNMAGYHFHFLSADKQRGGHVLEFEMEPGAVCEANMFEEFLMKNAPQEGGLIQAQGISQDQFKALIQKVE